MPGIAHSYTTPPPCFSPSSFPSSFQPSSSSPSSSTTTTARTGHSPTARGALPPPPECPWQPVEALLHAAAAAAGPAVACARRPRSAAEAARVHAGVARLLGLVFAHGPCTA